MRIEAGGAPEPDEAAAIVAALAALTTGSGEDRAVTQPSGWRLAARAFDDGYDADRALRRAKRRTS
jgi:hypothetical protein